jgi:glycosyltransferase involved in cell wall biosynthesis
MRIAVNTRFLISDRLEGLGRFTYETMRCMVEQHPEHEFIFFFDRPFSSEFLFASNVKGVKLFPPARHPLLFPWYFEWSVYRALKKYKPDVFLSCDGFLSLRTNVPQVAVIHDLAFEHHPRDVSFFARYYYKFFFPRFARKAKQICTVSRFSANDIATRYNIGVDKINVVYNGASTLFKPVSEEIKQTIRNRYTAGQKYFVYAGALQPRKNIGRLLRAFDAFKQQSGSAMKLLVVGRKAWKTKDIESTYNAMAFKDDVCFTGRVTDTDLAAILGGAIALTYVPYLEGFGIPILEALQCGTPVITSNITAMPEVAGDGGLLVDPYDEQAICKAMVAMASDTALRIDLSKKGELQARKFSWESTAESVWESITAI